MIINIFISESLSRSCTGRLYSPSIIARHIYYYQECLGAPGRGCCSALCAHFWDCLIKVCRRQLADAEKVLGRGKAPRLCPVPPTTRLPHGMLLTLLPKWEPRDISRAQWVQAVGRQRRDEDDPAVWSWCWAPEPNTKLPATAPPGRASLPAVAADKLQWKHYL